MRKILMLLFVLIFATFTASVNAVTAGLTWQDGSREITINDGDSVQFQADAGSFNKPLTINLFLMNDNYEYIYERDLVVNDYIFGDFYLVEKDHYKNPGDYIIYFEVSDKDNDAQIHTLNLHVQASESEAVNNAPVVTDIAMTENEGLFSFTITASDADNDNITDYETRVVARGNEYSAFCDGNVCTFDSKDPTNDGFELIRFDENAVVKARAYDGKNWGNWHEKKFVIDNRDTIVVEDDDHEPVLEFIGDKEVFENSELRFTVSATDEDNDVFAVNAENLPAGSSFQNNVFAWKPGYEVVGHGGIINGILKFISFGMLGSEPSSDFEITFTVIDSKANYDVEKIKIKVKDTNRLPALEVSDVNVNEGELVKAIPLVSDADGDKIKVSFSAPLNSNGEWQTGFEDSGIHVVTVTADDSYNGIVRKNININVNDVNRAPVIDSIDGAREVFEGELVELKANAHDDDLDAILYSVNSNLFSKFGNIFRWQTNIGDAGTYSLTFSVDDGKNGKDSENLVLIVKEKINLAPTAEILKPEKDVTINTGDSLEFVGRGEDSDGAIEEYKWLINGEKVSSEDKFTYTFDQESNNKVEFLVRDNRDKWSEPDSVNVKVENKIIILNSAPVIDSIGGAREIFAGNVIELTVNAHDADSDDLTFTITGNKFSQNGNRFIWRTSESDVGNHVFIVNVTDGELTDYEVVIIVVKEKPKINNAPVVIDILDQEGFIGTLFIYQVVATDEDKDSLTYSLIEKPSGMSIDSNGKISWRVNRVGSYNIVVGVSDSKITVSEEFKLVVKESPKVNNAPNAVIDSPPEDVINIFKGNSVDFRGHGEDVDNNRITEYLWSFSEVRTDSNEQNVFVVFDKVGSFLVTFNVRDEKGAWDETPDTVLVNVKEKPAENQAPIVGDIPDQTITSGQAFNDINLDTFVIDLDNPNNEIRWSISGNVRLIIDVVEINANKIAKISYPSGFTGSETITFTAIDPSGARNRDTAVFTVQAPITPTPTNNNPVLNVKRAGSIVSKAIINEGENLILNLEGSDADNDPLRYSAMNMPAGAVLTGNVFSWTPSNVQGGKDYFVAFRVFDLTSNGRLKGGNDLKIITITVNDNLEPVTTVEKARVNRHVLNIKNMIINNWETVKKEELFDFDVVVENKGNVRENNVKITLQIPQLDYYERSNNFDIKKNNAETRGFSVLVPEDISDEVIYAIVTVSSDKDEVTEVIGFLVE